MEASNGCVAIRGFLNIKKTESAMVVSQLLHTFLKLAYYSSTVQLQ